MVLIYILKIHKIDSTASIRQMLPEEQLDCRTTAIAEADMNLKSYSLSFKKKKKRLELVQ